MHFARNTDNALRTEKSVKAFSNDGHGMVVAGALFDHKSFTTWGLERSAAAFDL